MTESLDEMRARHVRELDEKLSEVAQAMYALGFSRSPMEPSAVSTIAAIHGEVASRRGVLASKMLERNRSQKVVWARQEAYALALEAGYSLGQIGEYFGGYDHTSIYHGIKAHRLRAAKV